MAATLIGTDECDACPKCGGTSGYIVSLRVSGTVKECWFWDGEHDGRLNGEDGLAYVERETVRCADCNARFPNPHLRLTGEIQGP